MKMAVQIVCSQDVGLGQTRRLAVATFQADVEWIAMFVGDQAKMADFKPSHVERISLARMDFPAPWTLVWSDG